VAARSLSTMATRDPSWGPPFCQPIKRDYPIWRKADLDSLFFLFFDNMSSLLGITAALIEIPKLARGGCWHAGMSCWATAGPYITEWEDMIFSKVVPGIGVSLIFGNIWYAWMAFKLAGFKGSNDVTALPYGINTPAGFLSAYSIMFPIAFKYYGEQDPKKWCEKCWHAAAAATVIGGIFEIVGAFIGPYMRRVFSRAAIFTPIACVGFVWLGFVPFIGVMREPIIGGIPFAITILGFFANGGKGVSMFGLPFIRPLNFLFIVTVGTIFKWAGAGKFNQDVDVMWDQVEDYNDRFTGKNTMTPFVILQGLEDLETSLLVVFPIAMQSFVETMENVELAASKGDQYNMREAMVVDGLGTMVGGLFGSVMPTTVYIGHTRHKLNGSSAGYSLANALLYLIITMAGLLPVIYSFVDDVSVGCSLIAVGLMIVQDTIELSHPRHVPAIAIGLMFVIADPWHFDMREPSTAYCTRSVQRMRGLRNMWPGGGILCSLIVTQIITDMIDMKYVRGCVYCVLALFLSLFGLMHGNNTVKPDGERFFNAGEGELTITFKDDKGLPGDPPDLNEGWRFCVMYAMLFVYLGIHAIVQKVKPDWLPPPTPGNGYPEGKDPSEVKSKPVDSAVA